MSSGLISVILVDGNLFEIRNVMNQILIHIEQFLLGNRYYQQPFRC